MIEMKTAAPQALRRLGIVMEPNPADRREAEGVLNPAVARGPDGQLYLLPRLVAPGNYSRIGLARVIFDRHNTPVGVERLGMALEPQAPYELNAQTGGGVEDPRVTYLAARRLYVMTYTALGPAGPRAAAAVSRDLVHWRRMGPLRWRCSTVPPFRRPFPPGHRRCGPLCPRRPSFARASGSAMRRSTRLGPAGTQSLGSITCWPVLNSAGSTSRSGAAHPRCGRAPDGCCF